MFGKLKLALNKNEELMIIVWRFGKNVRFSVTVVANKRLDRF